MAIRRRRHRAPERPSSQPLPVHLKQADHSNSGKARPEYLVVVLS